MKQLQAKEEVMCDINEEPLLSGIRSHKSGFNYLTNYCYVQAFYIVKSILS